MRTVNASVPTIASLLIACAGTQTLIATPAPVGADATQRGSGLGVPESFDPNGAFDVAIKNPEAGPSPASAADWPFRIPRAQVEKIAADRAAQDLAIAKLRARPIALTAANVPNYFIFQGEPMAWEFDGSRLAIRIEGGEAAARGVSSAAKIALLDWPCTTVKDWVLLPLAKPVADTAEARAALEALLQSPAVKFASPVFLSATSEGGWTLITSDVNARAANEGVAPAAEGELVADQVWTAGPLGHIPGGVHMRSTLRNGFDVLVRANQLARDPRFVWAEPDVLEAGRLNYIPDDPSLAGCWGVHNTGQSGGTADADMDGPEAWEITTGRSDVLACVLDIGCQFNHPDLNMSVFSRDFTTGAAQGVGTGSPGNACDNHGTSVTGMISMRIDNGIGGVGIAPDCPTLFCKVSDNVNDPPTCTNSFGAYSDSWVVNALAWGASHGCRVTNMSFNAGNYQTIIDAVQTAYLTDGMVNFAATGNGGSDSIGDPTIGFTSAMAFETAVGAMNRLGQRAGFSNYGTGLDLSAPGQNVLSADRTGTDGYNQVSTANGGDYATVNGTSFASPSAAGCQVLFFAAYPFATQVEGLAAILGGATDLGTAGYDTNFGYGFVNAYGAILDANPSGDFCDSATVVSLDSNGVYNPAIKNTRWATPNRNEPTENCGSPSGNTANVYYSFTATNTGTLSLNTNGSDYDTVLSVWNGCGFFIGSAFIQPTLLACDDDSGTGSASQITNLPVVIGQTYLIKVAKYGTTPGGGMLDFNMAFTATPPANDACSAATVITDPGAGVFSFNPAVIDTQFATTVSCEPRENCGSPNGNSNSVYFKYVPAHQGTITVDTIGSNYDSVLSIFSGCGFTIAQLPPNPPLCLQPTLYACNDDALGLGLQSQISGFGVTGGDTYLIKIANWGLPDAGALNFNFSFAPFVPSNDSCVNATVIPPVSGQYHPGTYDTFFATSELCEDQESCEANAAGTSHSVWYTFTAPVGGHGTISTAGSSFDTVLSVFTGCGSLRGNVCTAPPQIACNDDANGTLQSEIAGMAMTAGQTYLIKAARFGASSPGGILDFSFTFTPNCAADFNHDGDLNPDDLGDYITCYFTEPPCPGADYNVDGDVNPDDLGDYITAYFQGC